MDQEWIRNGYATAKVVVEANACVCVYTVYCDVRAAARGGAHVYVYVACACGIRDPL